MDDFRGIDFHRVLKELVATIDSHAAKVQIVRNTKERADALLSCQKEIREWFHKTIDAIESDIAYDEKSLSLLLSIQHDLNRLVQWERSGYPSPSPLDDSEQILQLLCVPHTDSRWNRYSNMTAKSLSKELVSSGAGGNYPFKNALSRLVGTSQPRGWEKIQLGLSDIVKVLVRRMGVPEKPGSTSSSFQDPLQVSIESLASLQPLEDISREPSTNNHRRDGEAPGIHYNVPLSPLIIDDGVIRSPCALWVIFFNPREAPYPNAEDSDQPDRFKRFFIEVRRLGVEIGEDLWDIGTVFDKLFNQTKNELPLGFMIRMRGLLHSRNLYNPLLNDEIKDRVKKGKIDGLRVSDLLYWPLFKEDNITTVSFDSISEALGVLKHYLDKPILCNGYDKALYRSILSRALLYLENSKTSDHAELDDLISEKLDELGPPWNTNEPSKFTDLKSTDKNKPILNLCDIRSALCVKKHFDLNLNSLTTKEKFYFLRYLHGIISYIDAMKKGHSLGENSIIDEFLSEGFLEAVTDKFYEVADHFPSKRYGHQSQTLPIVRYHEIRRGRPILLPIEADAVHLKQSVYDSVDIAIQTRELVLKRSKTDESMDLLEGNWHENDIDRVYALLFSGKLDKSTPFDTDDSGKKIPLSNLKETKDLLARLDKSGFPFFKSKTYYTERRYPQPYLEYQFSEAMTRQLKEARTTLDANAKDATSSTELLELVKEFRIGIIRKLNILQLLMMKGAVLDKGTLGRICSSIKECRDLSTSLQERYYRNDAEKFRVEFQRFNEITGDSLKNRLVSIQFSLLNSKLTSMCRKFKEGDFSSSYLPLDDFIQEIFKEYLISKSTSELSENPMMIQVILPQLKTILLHPIQVKSRPTTHFSNLFGDDDCFTEEQKERLIGTIERYIQWRCTDPAFYATPSHANPVKQTDTKATSFPEEISKLHQESSTDKNSSSEQPKENAFLPDHDRTRSDTSFDPKKPDGSGQSKYQSIRRK